VRSLAFETVRDQNRIASAAGGPIESTILPPLTRGRRPGANASLDRSQVTVWLIFGVGLPGLY